MYNRSPDQRMAELGQVDSNLMLASGFKAAFDQRGAHEPCDRFDVRDRSVSPRSESRPSDVESVRSEPRIPSPRSRTRYVSTRVAVTAPCAMAW